MSILFCDNTWSSKRYAHTASSQLIIILYQLYVICHCRIFGITIASDWTISKRIMGQVRCLLVPSLLFQKTFLRLHLSDRYGIDESLSLCGNKIICVLVSSSCTGNSNTLSFLLNCHQRLIAHPWCEVVSKLFPLHKESCAEGEKRMSLEKQLL